MNLATHCPNCFKILTACSCNLNYNLISTNTDLLPPFTTLDEGRYCVGRVLGRGGFGVVYAGYDTTLEKLSNDIKVPLAIKEFFPAKIGLATRNANYQVDPNPQRIEEFRYWQKQFLQEALILLQLTHSNIVRLYTILHAENSTSYLIMERLYGDTLVEYLGGLKTTADRLLFNKQLPIEEANSLFKVAIKALEYLHGRSAGPIIHLDINPNNIFILNQQPDQIKLLDFGLARDNTELQDRALGVMGGHPNFMAPEQAQQKTHQHIAASADCYSLGACMYASITGQAPPPAIARLTGTPLADIGQQIPQLRNSALAETIMACLNLDPIQRPQNAMLLAKCLEDTNERRKYLVTKPERLLESNCDPTTIIFPIPTNTSESPNLQSIQPKFSEPINPIISLSEAKKTNFFSPLSHSNIKKTRHKKHQKLLTHPWIFKIVLAIALSSLTVIGIQFIHSKLFYTPPQISYQINHDGTITDNLNSLVWKRCSEGQIWNGTTCTGSANNYTWNQIMPQKQQKIWEPFAKHNDWHVPNINELRTLVWCSNGTAQTKAWDNLCSDDNSQNEKTYIQPTIDPTSFPNTPINWFWSTTIAPDSKNVQIVYFTNGGIFWTNRTNSGHIRLARAIVPH